MKQIWGAAIALFLTLIACTKSNTTKTLDEANGCIERIIIPVTAHSINVSDITTVNSLFISNGINNSKFRYCRYIHDTLQTLYAPYARYDQKAVSIYQYTNGIRIFTGDLGYIFLNNNLNYRAGDLTNGTTLDTIPKLTLGQIRKLFLDNIEQFDHSANYFKDSCFRAEFGYYNLNAGTGNAQEILVKAWRVAPKSNEFLSEYPVAFYQDNDGKLIYYDNGIRTFK